MVFNIIHHSCNLLILNICGLSYFSNNLAIFLEMGSNFSRGMGWIRKLQKVLSNPEIYSAFSHSLVFVLFYSLIPIVVGLLITLLLLRIKIRGESFFRAILFLPQIISTVVVAISWRWIYAADGPINSLLAKFGAEKLQLPGSAILIHH